MIIDRNTDTLDSCDSISSVLNRLFETVIQHQLGIKELEQLYRSDVIACIPGGALGLSQFASGYYRASLRSLYQHHCEFLYVVDGGRSFGLDSRNSADHYTRMTMEQRRSAVCGYAWQREYASAPVCWFSVPCTEAELINRVQS